MKMLRTLVAVLVAYLLGYFLTPLLPPAVAGMVGLPVVILFAAIFGVLVFVVVDRRERLKEAVATELNKLRRIYHLGKNLGNSPHLRGWFTELHGYIYDYLGSFEKLSLSDYDKSNPLFRRIAYHVYTVPDLREVKEQVLYNELLAATAIVSDARQRILTLEKSSYSRGHWFELAVIFVLFVITVVSSTPDEPMAHFVTSNILAIGTLMALTFLEHDVWTAAGNRYLAMDYVKNIARLELRRG